MKVCPKCGKKWPETGKFCPMDGTPLVSEVEDDEPDSRPTRVLGPEELPVDAAREPPARPIPPVAEPAPPPPATASRPRPCRTPPPAEDAGPAEPDRPGAFSETKWFMVGDHIKDEEIEASDLPVEDLQEIYKRTGALPEEVRKKYSLRYGTDEDRKSGRDPRKKK